MSCLVPSFVWRECYERKANIFIAEPCWEKNLVTQSILNLVFTWQYVRWRSRGKHWETLRFDGNKINCFPRNQSLSDLLLYSWKFIKPRCNGGRRSTFPGNSAPLSSDVIDFAMLPARRFWQETVSLLDVMWRQRNPWERALLGKIASYITKWIIRGLEIEIWECGESDSTNRCCHHWNFPIFFWSFYLATNGLYHLHTSPRPTPSLFPSL